MTNELTREQAVQEVARLIKDIKFCMLTTVTDEGRLHARPITTQQVEFDGDLWFIGGKDSEWVHDISQRTEVGVSYAKPGDMNFVSITGRAELVEDRAKLEELWSDFYKAYFPGGMDDPNVQLIKVTAHGAEFWESDSKPAVMFKLAQGMVTGDRPAMGTNETVSLE